MYARGTEWMLRCAALLALLLPASPARAQWDARPPGRLAALTSGPVAVPLVATLQSLSVNALPAASSISGLPTWKESDLTVTTAWTIRANCTTLRLSGYSGSFEVQSSNSDPPSFAEGDPAGSVAQEPINDMLYEDGTGFSGIAQPVGPTNYPGSRTDNVEVSMSGPDHSSPAMPVAPIYIVAQAL